METKKDSIMKTPSAHICNFNPNPLTPTPNLTGNRKIARSDQNQVRGSEEDTRGKIRATRRVRVRVRVRVRSPFRLRIQLSGRIRVTVRVSVRVGVKVSVRRNEVLNVDKLRVMRAPSVTCW